MVSAGAASVGRLLIDSATAVAATSSRNSYTRSPHRTTVTSVGVAARPVRDGSAVASRARRIKGCRSQGFRPKRTRTGRITIASFQTPANRPRKPQVAKAAAGMVGTLPPGSGRDDGDGGRTGIGGRRVAEDGPRGHG